MCNLFNFKKITKVLFSLILCFSFSLNFLLNSASANTMTVSRTAVFTGSGVPWQTWLKGLGWFVRFDSPDSGYSFTRLGSMECNFTTVSKTNYTYLSGGYLRLYVTDDRGVILYDNNFTVGSGLRLITNHYDGYGTGNGIGQDQVQYQLTLPDIYDNYGSSYFYLVAEDHTTGSNGLMALTNTSTPYTISGGYSPTLDEIDNATLQIQRQIQSAVDAANNASNAANNASSYASQALNWLNGTWGGYNLGTVGINATNAMNNSATSNSYLTNGTYGLNAINTNVTNIQSGVNSLQTSTNNIQTGVNNLQTTANNIQSSVSSIQTSVNNITSVMPPTLNKVTGYNGATATSSTSFNVSLDYTNANEYSYKIDGGSWSTWYSLSTHDTLGYLTVPGISGTGMHTVYIQIRNNVSGQISPGAKGKVVVFKL
jgi:hypothetical protein